jgi:hypothetical protein
MTTITKSTNVGITLSSPTDVNPIVIDSGVTISNVGNAVYGPGGSWTIQNDGKISSSFLDGVLLRAGSVTNASTDSITGVVDGVAIAGTAGTVVNSGSIAGTGTAGIGVVLRLGGSVSNAAGAAITGNYDGTYIYGSAPAPAALIAARSTRGLLGCMWPRSLMPPSPPEDRG